MARTLITSDNFSPLVLIITWFLCIISVLSMVARGATKIIFIRSMKPDDYSSLSSLFLSIAQSIAVTVRTSNGLGKHITALSDAQISAYSKATYAANILYISSMCLSELSVVLFLRNITPVQQDRNILFGAGSITLLWTVTGVIVSAAECGSPRPWNYFTGGCIDRVIWWNCVEVMTILINFALIAIPVWIISKVQVSLLRKFSVGSIFALRITVCIASTCKLVYWNRARYSRDLTLELWPVTLCTQTIQCMSIASFCCIYLKPLFETLDSGFIRSDEFRRKGQMNPEGSYNLSTLSSGKESRKDAKNLARLARTENNDTTITALNNEAGWDAGSQNSEAQIIKETRTFAIESSAAGGHQVSP